MKKWVMCVGVVLALFFVAGSVNAQGRHAKGPRMGGRDFGPGPRVVRGPQGGERPEGPGEADESPFVGSRHEDGRDNDSAEADEADESGSGDEQRFTAESGDYSGEHQTAMAPAPAFEHHHALRQHLAALFHRVGPLGLLLIAVVVIPVLAVLFWVLPITLGVRIARRRKLSPLWMLFGIHPLGGWIACLVLALSRAKVECSTCGGHVKRNFRQCPFCHGAVAAPTPPKA